MSMSSWLKNILKFTPSAEVSLKKKKYTALGQMMDQFLLRNPILVLDLLRFILWRNWMNFEGMKLLANN